MANLKNKTSITSLVALALTIVGIIVYFVNIGSAGYFQRAAVPAAVTWFLLGAAALVVVVLLSMLKLTGIAGKATGASPAFCARWSTSSAHSRPRRSRSC